MGERSIEDSQEVQAKRVKEESGTISSESNLVCFLYLLLRDALPAGEVEKLVTEVVSYDQKPYVFSNGWLGQYALNIKSRLDD